MSKNKQDLGPYRRKQFQTYFQFSLIAICFVIIFVLFYACTGRSKNDIDYTDAKVIQMDEPADDSPVVVLKQTRELSRLCFSLMKHRTIASFHRTCGKGYYDGTYVSMVQDGVYFIGGTKQADGQTTSDTDTTTIEAEYSKNLWPLKVRFVHTRRSKVTCSARRRFQTAIFFLLITMTLPRRSRRSLTASLQTATISLRISPMLLRNMAVC